MMIPQELQKKLIADGYELFDIDQAAVEVAKIPSDAVVFYDKFRVNYRLVSAIPAGVKKVQGFDLVNNLKAIKNPVELKNFKYTNVIECASLFKFFNYIKKHAAEGKLNEYNVGPILASYRNKYPEALLTDRCTLMTAYMANGAGPHYTATEAENAEIKPTGVLLIDTGGHYLSGSTDITRTLYMGPSEYDAAIKHDYTLTLISLMDLTRQVIRDGADGAYLDSVARRVMWNEHLQYGYGTGHGVGYCIVAHEGPQFISEPSYKKEWAFCFLPLKPNMVMALEPGIYREGKYGIRLENNVYITEDCVNEYGTFYRFQTMSYVPFERELIDLDMLTNADIDWINEYHQKTLELLTPYLEADEVEDLKKATAPLCR